MDRLTSLFDRALDAVVGMDHRGKVIAWNKAAEELFKWPRDEALGQSMAKLIVPPQHQMAHSKGLAHYNKTGHGPVLEKRVKITAVDKSKFEFPIELSIFPMHHPEGDTFYAFIRSLLFEEAHRVELELRSQEAEVLLTIATNLIQDTSLEEFTKLCLRKVCEVAGLDAAHMFYVRGRPESRKLMPSGIWYVSDPKFDPVAEDTASRSFGKGEGLPGTVWQTGDAVSIMNIPEEPGFIRRDSFSAVGLTQGFAVPIVLDGEIGAVMEFFGATDARIDEEVIRLVRTIASHIGLAIQRKAEAEERTLLRRELAHRLGNSLAILSAIFRATAAKAETVAELKQSFSDRLLAVARAYEVVPKVGDRANLAELVEEAFELLPDKSNLRIDLPEIHLPPEAILPLSLLISELVTNHLKHGAPGNIGRVRISTEPADDPTHRKIVWREPCSRVSLSDREGYGSYLIRAMIEDRLQGRFRRTVEDGHLKVEIDLPGSAIG